MSQYSVKFHEDKRHAVYARDGYKCQYCGHHDATKSGGGLSIDHIVAREAGGEPQNNKTDGATNLITTCGSCNYSKQSKSPREFNAYLKANGKNAIDWGAVRAQAKKKIDIATGEKNAAAARSFRESKGEPMPKASHEPERHEKKAPDHAPEHGGPGVRHGDDGKFLPGTRSLCRFAAARGIITTADGKAPHSVRLWRAGWNMTDKGRVKFTPRSAELVMQAFADRGNPIVFDYEHEGLLPLEKRGGAPMRGIASAPHSLLEVRQDASGKPELWAVDIAWTPEAARQIEAGERRQISPVSDFDRETREITAIVNVALCREGATHHGTILASADKGIENMDEIIQKIMEALQAGDFETAETLVQQAEAMDGGGDNAMVKMARGACGAYAAKPGAPPADDAPGSGKKPAVAAGRSPMAASRDLSALRGDASFSRVMGELEAATARADAAAKRSDRAAVTSLIAASRECFDPADEREHLAASDPTATERHIKSIKRKLATGTIVATRQPTERKEPEPKKEIDASYGLDAFEIEAAAKSGIELKDYAEHKKTKLNLASRGKN
jgi:hypothetical protein